MNSNVTIDSRILWLIRDAERILSSLNATLTTEYRRGLESMTPQELMRLVIKLSHATPSNATTTLVQSLTESELARLDCDLFEQWRTSQE